MRSVFQYLGEVMVATQYWPSTVQKYSKNIVNTFIDVTKSVINHFKPTPTKAHYTFSWRDLVKVFLSAQMVEGNSLKGQENVIKLVYHECLRTYGDRLLIDLDREWFLKNLEEICRQHFNIIGEDGSNPNSHEQELGRGKTKTKKCKWPIADPERLFLSHWNKEAEGFYMEVDKVDDIKSVIEGNLERYNDSNERIHIDLMLYNQLNR